MRTQSRRRAGITLVEVLVTIAIIGILLSLLLPAISAARASARKAQCGNNLKQLAAAVHQHQQRMEAMPPYWGLHTGGFSDMFGGWLVHLLPDLGQQVVYDRIWNQVNPVRTLQSGTTYRYELVKTGRMLPATPQSNPYEPGQWVTRQVGTANIFGTLIPIYRTSLEGRVGNPAYPERPEWGWQPVEAIPVTSTINDTQGFSNNFGVAQNSIAASGGIVEGAPASFPFLQDVADVSDVPPDGAVVVNNSNWKDKNGKLPLWSLTNYVANAHAFAKFGDRLVLPGSGSGVPASSVNATEQVYIGLFTPPLSWPGKQPAGNWRWRTDAQFNNTLSIVRGFQPRRLSHIGDGLSNTIMFGEAMRKCDGAYRVAFLPCGFQTWEHGFGIEPSFPDVNGTTMYPGSEVSRTFGHTLMFQSQPGDSECNPMRTQAMHGPYLMTAMCDGSVRAISSMVTRKEAIGANATGREGFGTKFYTMYSRSVADPNESGTLFERPDGIWDMLLVPNDPPTNVLSNTGEVGKEK